MKEVENEGILKCRDTKEPKTWKQRKMEQHKKEWTDKPLHGQMAKATKELMNKEKNWNSVKNAGLKKETESTIFSSQ